MASLIVSSFVSFVLWQREIAELAERTVMLNDEAKSFLPEGKLSNVRRFVHLSCSLRNRCHFLALKFII